MSLFACVPVELMQDDRLTFRQYRLIVALLSFCPRGKNTCFPSRKMLAERARMSIAKVSETSAQLVELGWLEKTGNGGKGKATRYTILTPQTSHASGDVSSRQEPSSDAPETVPDSGTVTEGANGSRIGNQTVPDSGRGIEQTINRQVPAPDKLEREARATRAPARKPAVPPCPDDVPAELYAEWLDYRRAAGAKPLWNARAEALMRGGAKRAGISLAKAMEYTMARTWKGFYPTTYLRDEKPQQNGARQFKTAREIDDERAADLWNTVTGGHMGAKQTAQIIDVTATHREHLQLLEKTA